jgi:prepilin-type N-terminal cleavage/methylation domain-containing protein
VCCHQQGRRGFTLIELVVVLFILALTVATVGFSTGLFGARDAFESKIQKFYQILRLLHEETLFSHRTAGVMFSRGQICFLNKTQISPESRVLTWKARQDIPCMHFSETEADNMVLKREDHVLALPQTPPEIPQIILMPGGSISPFAFVLGHYSVVGQYSGDIVLTTVP